MASESPILIATPDASRASVSAPVPQFIPPAWQIINKMPTRSSTPSSISSPLALVAPNHGNATVRTRPATFWNHGFWSPHPCHSAYPFEMHPLLHDTGIAVILQ
ncbi:uncharacterized protein F5147DRAFT_780243 [Suillus discolor]|uniref:Uncharacterized protein n=1 Tax=Suillus discolor TaxID=1912936 RepID=A0A9P7EU87_9AGAM|nr:uncharacterized protein F5147DRAFT_780243 [Suillus discolor]KAG2090590.1 hypothetical protein F5147DRAFT_780243 [Suillus discolor]